MTTRMDSLVRMHGFADAAEYSAMMSAVDVSTPERYRAFKDWQEGDGSKTGLQQLMDRERPGTILQADGRPMMHDIIRAYDWPWRRDCYLEGIVAKFEGNFIAFIVMKRVIEGIERPVANQEVARAPVNGASMFDDNQSPRVVVLRNAPACFTRPAWFDVKIGEAKW